MGGNIFDTTSPIKRERIFHTLIKFGEAIENVFGEKITFDTLGSVFKKDVSGDIDIATDMTDIPTPIINLIVTRPSYSMELEQIRKRSRSATEEQMKRKAFLRTMAGIINDHYEWVMVVNEKRTTDDTIFIRFPQYDYNGITEDEYVQIDWMFGNLDWLKFSYNSSSYEGNIKGLHRTQLLVALFSVLGYTFSHGNGVKLKGTSNWLMTSPDEILTFLSQTFLQELTIDQLYNYDELIDLIRHTPHFDLTYDVWDEYLKILDSTRCDIPNNLQEYWRSERERLGLTGKFLPEDSKLNRFLV